MVHENSEKIEGFSTCGTLKHFQETSQNLRQWKLVQTKNKFI
jgi:hypothetical protein